MKKTRRVWVMTVVLILVGTSLIGCQNKTNVAPEQPVEEEQVEEQEMTYFPAIERYLVNEIGKHYGEGEYIIPVHDIVDVDERNSDDILVWGDYWVYVYNQVGDTLKMVSGGNHPGLLHIRQTEKGFEVTGFDQVEDGSSNLPSAKKIFGDKYDAFHAINSDEKKREQRRAEMTAAYVKAHNLTATMYQDYGWPAVALPLNQE